MKYLHNIGFVFASLAALYMAYQINLLEQVPLIILVVKILFWSICILGLLGAIRKCN